MCKYATHLKSLVGFFIILLSFSVSSQEIDAPRLDFVNACGSVGNNTFTFEFDFSGTSFGANNNFIIYLSDENGDFTNPINIATLTDNALNSQFFDIFVSFNLPDDLVGGDGYQIRVESTDPQVIGRASVPFQAYYEPDIRLTLNDNDDAVLCNGESLTISLEDKINNTNLDDYSFAWFFNGIIMIGESDSTLTVTQPGEYYATFDVGPICTLSAQPSNKSIVTTLNVEDVFIEGNNTVVLCSDETYDLVASVDNSDYTYNWYKDDELLSSGYLPTFTTQDNDQFGTYRLELDTGVGCLAISQNVEIEQQVGAGFTVSVDSDTTRVLLPGETVVLTVTVEPSSSSLSYQWFKNGEELSANTQSEINIIDAGEYFVEVTDSSSSCSVALNSEVYTFLDAVSLVTQIVPENYEECNSLTTNIRTVGVKALATDGLEYELTSDQLALSSFRYEWYKDNVIIAGETTDGLSVTSYANNGDYHLNTSVGGGSSLVSGESNHLNIFLSPGTEIESSSISNKLCTGSVINLSIDTLTGYTYTWFKDDVELTVTDVSSVDVSEVGVYYVTYEGFDCLIETERIEILEFDEEVLEVDPSTTAVLVPGETTVLSATGADSYEWYGEDGTLLSTNETLEVSALGVFTLIGTVGDCQVEKEIQVVEDDGSFIIPNIITPFNGDGVNDTWQIPNKFSFQSDVQVIIYNSKSNEVFNITDYQNDWPEDTSNIRGGALFYFRVIKDDSLVKAGTISILE